MKTNIFLEKRAFLSTESENNIELEKKIEIRERQNGKIREQRNYEKKYLLFDIFHRNCTISIRT